MDSNHRPAGYESAALTAELRRRAGRSVASGFHANALAKAVAAAATTMTARIGSRSTSAAPAAAIPTARASSTSSSSAANTCVTTSAASSAGASSSMTPSRRGGRLRPPMATGPSRLERDRQHADDRDHDPDGGHGRLQPDKQTAAAATIGTPGRRDRDQRQRDRSPSEGGGDRRAAAQLRDEQGEEERGKRRVETEPLGVAEQIAGERPERRTEHPARVEHEPRAEQQSAVEAAAAPVGDRPRLVHDQLRLDQPPRGPAAEERRDRDPDRRVPAVQQDRGRDRRRDGAALVQDRRGRELRRSRRRSSPT